MKSDLLKFRRKILAWAGLGIPSSTSDEQQKGSRTAYQIPPGRNKKVLEFYGRNVIPLPIKHGFDNTKHFRRHPPLPYLWNDSLTILSERQNTMVLPEYQRRGLGRLLSQKCSEIADAGKAATYVRAQPGAAGLFI